MKIRTEFSSSRKKELVRSVRYINRKVTRPQVDYTHEKYKTCLKKYPSFSSFFILTQAYRNLQCKKSSDILQRFNFEAF